MPAKPRTRPIVKIATSSFTPYMMMQLKIAMLRYKYLMDEYPHFQTRSYNPNDDFVVEYYDFYALNASLKDFTRPDVVEEYFNMLKTTQASTATPASLADDLKTTTGITNTHISFMSKLLHTQDPSKPILDSRILDYLNAVYGVNKTSLLNIESWYKNSAYDPDRNALVTWFRSQPDFASFASVSDMKVVDTMIFVWHKFK